MMYDLRCSFEIPFNLPNRSLVVDYIYGTAIMIGVEAFELDNGEFIGIFKKSNSKAILLRDKMFLNIIGEYLGIMCVSYVVDSEKKQTNK